MGKGISFFFVGLMVFPLSFWMFLMVIGYLDFSYTLLTYTLLTLSPLVIAFSFYSRDLVKAMIPIFVLAITFVFFVLATSGANCHCPANAYCNASPQFNVAIQAIEIKAKFHR